MYRMDSVLYLILLVSEMLKIQRAKVEVYFLKKFYFATNKCLAQDAFGKCPKTTENLSKYTAVREQLCAQIFLLSLIFYKSILVSELYWLPRCISPYKQSLKIYMGQCISVTNIAHLLEIYVIQLSMLKRLTLDFTRSMFNFIQFQLLKVKTQSAQVC